MNQLDLKPETALAHQKIQGMITLCFENERPLRGMIGYLDWRFNGYFTRLMKQQVLTGTPGECTYVPLLWNDLTFHFLIVGAGSLPDHGHRPGFSKELFNLASKHMKKLNLKNMGVSALDWDLNLASAKFPEDPDLWILN